MDQDSSNGAGADKRNWRERLGIGAKELPKLSDEFREETAAQSPPPAAGTAKPAPRAPQPVTKPAPMAPRAAAKPAQEAPAAAQATAAPPPTAPAAPVSRATPKAPDNATQDALAEKLRAQRAAAERLAEQRVQAARNRAESKPKVEPARPAAPPPRAAAAAPTPSAGRTPPPPAAPAAGARPKFSFADDARSEAPPRTGLSAAPAPLTPPRPSLGGERSQPPFLRPGTGAANGSLGARPQPTFRPAADTGTAGYVSPPRLQAPAAPRAGLGSEAAGYGAARVPARRAPPPALDSYAPRQPEPRDYPEDDFQDEEPRTPPRLGRPGAAPRGRVQQDDFDEVFEEEQAPRGRAAARDYQNAYNEVEDAFADEPRRSSGPWLLLLALLAAAVLTGAVVWFYSDNVRNLAGVGSSSSSSEGTPVVPAPAEPAKVSAPEPGGEGQAETPARKKQIYDRIVGEQEVMGNQQMQPTEEMPVLPADAQPVDQVPKIEPAGSANPIPVPDAQNQGTGEGLPEVEPPPPLPIPGSDQQGSLGLKGTGQQIAAASAQVVEPELGSTAPPPPPPPSSAAKTTSSDASLPPPPETATDGAAFVSGGATSTTGNAGTAQTPRASAVVTTEDDDPETVPAAQAAQPAKKATQATSEQPAATPAKKKTQTTQAQPAATKKPAKKQQDFDNLGAAPVVLVPPSEEAMAAAQASNGGGAAGGVPQAQQPATSAESQQKRKSIFDLFNGAGSDPGPAQQAAPTQAAKPVQQKATTPPAQQQASTGGGYVVQLASYRSESEARTEYSRLAKAYPGVVGSLRSQIRQTSVAGSTRYQLGLGPLPTRGDATRVCGELIAAGESDCIIRGP